jgi:hypothetical protein
VTAEGGLIDGDVGPGVFLIAIVVAAAALLAALIGR